MCRVTFVTVEATVIYLPLRYVCYLQLRSLLTVTLFLLLTVVS